MKRIFTAYAPMDDITFIMEETYGKEGNITALECIGWYCGEPDEKCNETFAGKVRAVYEHD